MDASMYHSYQPLADPSRQIRLLKLWASSKSQAQLEATLQVAHLNNDPEQQQPQYYALSWFWGVPGRSKPLILNETIVQIRENLHSCLLDLINHTGDALIWIDALCINQFDDAEKSVQVAMMAEIYHTASGVIAWIGEGNAETHLVFKPSDFQPTTNEAPITAQDRRLCFQTILARPYWKRLWTVQERRFARQLWILCGEHIARWDKLPQPLPGAQSSVIRNSDFGVDRGAEDILNQPQSQLQMGSIKKKPLLALMEENKDLQCKDKRDKAYAIRSLAVERENLPVDYSKPLLQVFFDIFSVLDFSAAPQDLNRYNIGTWYDDLNVWRLLKVAKRPHECFRLTETDIAPLLSSETFMTYDRRHDISIMQPGEENHLNTWLVGSYASIIGLSKSASYVGRSFVIPESIRKGRFSAPEVLVGRRAGEFLQYRCEPSIKASDIRLHLSSGSVLEGALPIIRRNKSGGGDFICLARGHGIFDDENENEMRPIALRTLELLWGKNHIRVCTVSPKVKIIRFHKTGTRTCVVGVHFSKLALLTHFAIDRLPNGRGSTISDLPLYYQEAAERASVRSSPLSCRCRELSAELYG